MATQQRQQYIYDPLVQEKQTSNEHGAGAPKKESPIRLLNLHPGQYDDTLLGNLIVRQKEEYEALSYAWGDQSDKNSPTIGLLQDNKSKQLKITKNLASALRHLRDPIETKCFWVDAISINQSDKNEKSHQIPMMGKIYSEAKNVCIWLGETTETSSAALGHIERVLDLKLLDRLVSENHTADWAALSELMRRDWFSRRWVVQEIAFAQKASVHCGELEIAWSHLADAVALFGSRAEEIAELFRRDKNYNNQGDFLGDVEALGATRLVQTISKLFRKSDKGKKLEPLLSLEALVSNLSAFNASKPHDIIYAVLSLANDTITSARDSDTRMAPTTGDIPTIRTHDASTSDVRDNIGRLHVSSPDGNGALRPRLERKLSINSSTLSRAASPSGSRRQNMARSRSRSRGRSQPDTETTNGISREQGVGNMSHVSHLRGDSDIVTEIMRTEILHPEKNVKIKIFSDENEVRHALRRIRACKVKPRDSSLRRDSGNGPSRSADKTAADATSGVSAEAVTEKESKPVTESNKDNKNGKVSPVQNGNTMEADQGPSGSSNIPETQADYAVKDSHGKRFLGQLNGTIQNGIHGSDARPSKPPEHAPPGHKDDAKATDSQDMRFESLAPVRSKSKENTDQLNTKSAILVSDSDEVEFSAVRDGDLPPPKDLWDEEAIDYLRQGDPIAIYELTCKLLHAQRDLKQFVINTLKERVESKTFQVDYEKKKFYEVCKDFIEFTINQSKSLDMLCRPWAPDKEDRPTEDKDDLPSWVCPLSLSPFRPRHDGNYGRVNADLLVGMPDERGKTYNASATTKPEYFKFKDRNLLLHGFILDTIEEVRTEAIEGNVPHSWLDLGGWKNLHSEPPESFWRTLVADRDENGRNPPSYYQRACQYAFTQRVTGGSLNTERLIANDKSKIMTKYLKRVQAVVWMRKLIKTKPQTDREAGRLGLAPQRAQVGDKICILRGCSVPVVLRYIAKSAGQPTKEQVENKEPPDAGQPIIRRFTSARAQNTGIKFEKSGPYRLIGECYVHGVMDGEAFKIRDEYKLKEMEFEIH